MCFVINLLNMCIHAAQYSLDDLVCGRSVMVTGALHDLLLSNPFPSVPIFPCLFCSPIGCGAHWGPSWGCRSDHSLWLYGHPRPECHLTRGLPPGPLFTPYPLPKHLLLLTSSYIGVDGFLLSFLLEGPLLVSPTSVCVARLEPCDVVDVALGIVGIVGRWMSLLCRRGGRNLSAAGW